MKPRLPYGKSNCRAAANIPSSHGILLTIESRSRPCSQSKRGNQPGRANHGRRTNLSSQPKRGSWGNRPPRRRDPDRATRGPSQPRNNPFRNLVKRKCNGVIGRMQIFNLTAVSLTAATFPKPNIRSPYIRWSNLERSARRRSVLRTSNSMSGRGYGRNMCA